MTTKICFIDTETTGTTPGKHGIIQIAGVIVHAEGKLLIEHESFNFLVAPFASDEITQKALDVNGHTVEEIRSFEPPRTVHTKLTGIFGNHVDKYNKTDKMFFAGYNAPFDNDHMRAWFKKCSDNYFGSWFWSPAIDVMSLAAVRLLPERHTMPNFKLETVAEKCGVKLSNAHEAMSDIRATVSLYNAIVNNA